MNADRQDDPDADRRWLDALAGRRTDGDAADAATREAALMRDALRRWSVPADPAARDEPERRIARLLAALRAEGMLDAEPKSTHSTRPRSRFARLRDRWGPATAPPSFGRGMAVALALVVALSSPWWMRSSVVDRDEATVRGSQDSVAMLYAPEPEALRTEIVGALAGEGVAATTYRRLGRYGIDADLPDPLPERVRSVLRRYRVPVPADGVLRVEIAAGP